MAIKRSVSSVSSSCDSSVFSSYTGIAFEPRTSLRIRLNALDDALVVRR